MAEAIYYQLAEDFKGDALQLQAVCRVVQKIFQISRRVAILLDSSERARQLDDLLWTFNQGSFIPHGLAPCGEAVCLATDLESLRSYPILILLTNTLPTDLAGFERIVDFIFPAQDQVLAARERYKALQKQGFQLTLHKLGAKKT